MDVQGLCRRIIYRLVELIEVMALCVFGFQRLVAFALDSSCLALGLVMQVMNIRCVCM
jgi:hypothetical protein